ncbi:MAG: tRNA (adenosine(37)-N6)-dimethylallyltransferase MiaA [Actinomycetota bacterium]|nr:tRNA (adenosine(37)-N6)-dimethylallyltransferase MiaA [Actinomycetota bacterium]
MSSTAPAPAEPAVRGRVSTRIPFALVGPTASGKTEASIELARRLGAEIVVVDSMTVYRGLDVGTAKPAPALRRKVPHHLVDVAGPGEAFSVARFQSLAREALWDLRRRRVPALLVGGSGLYFRAIVDDLELPGTEPGLRRSLEAEAGALGSEALHARLASFDPEAAARMEPSNRRRVVRALEVAALTGRPFSTFASSWARYPEGRVVTAGVRLDPEALRRRIDERVVGMVDGGLLDEVRALMRRGHDPFLTASQAIGYVEAVQHLRGWIDREDMIASMSRRTRALARRQMAWFRRDPRIRWFDAGEDALAVVDDVEGWFRR